MSSEIEKVATDTLDILKTAIRATTDADEANEVRARVQAAKAWAKAHKCLGELRESLLVLEVEALVRTWELGGSKFLSGMERSSAAQLSEMGSAGRAALIRDYGTATTATGLLNAKHKAEHADEMNTRGRRWASHPDFEPSDDSVSVRLAAIVDELTMGDLPFSVAEMADRLINDVGWDPSDEAFREGANEVCRQALRRSGPDIDGLPLPKWLTVRVSEDDDTSVQYLRVPIMAATLAHLSDHIAIRQAQIDDDKAAVQRLTKTLRKLSAMGSADSRIGDLLTSAAIKGAA